MKEVTCNKCGRVHVTLSVFQCEATNMDLRHCQFCGNSYENFRDSVDGDCPDGATLNAIREFTNE